MKKALIVVLCTYLLVAFGGCNTVAMDGQSKMESEPAVQSDSFAEPQEESIAELISKAASIEQRLNGEWVCMEMGSSESKKFIEDLTALFPERFGELASAYMPEDIVIKFDLGESAQHNINVSSSAESIRTVTVSSVEINARGVVFLLPQGTALGVIKGIETVLPPADTGGETMLVAEAKTPWLEDYDTFWTIVEENYPLYAAAERITGNDFAAVKEKYRPQAAEAASAEELHKIIEECIEQFQGMGHFWLIPNKDAYQSIATIYGRLATEDPKCAYLYSRLSTPASIAYYGIDPAKEVERVLENGGDAVGTQSNGNLKFKDYPEDKTAYVSVAQMTGYYDNNDQEVLEDWFRALEDKGYQNCIIDICGNGGGDSSYWTENIVAPNLKQTYRVTNYARVQGQACIDYWQAAGRKLKPISTLNRNTLPALQPADLEGITHYITYTKEFNPVGAPLFSGRFWLLVDERVYSSSEMFAAFCKDTQFAALVGTRTGGDGIGEDPLLFALPNSGLCFRFSAEEGLNPDGSCNEEYGTQPDIAIKPGEDALAAAFAAIRKAK